LARKKKGGAKGTKGFSFGEKWAQVVALLGQLMRFFLIKSPYLENRLQQVTKP
jgi:hypothetical protein